MLWIKNSVLTIHRYYRMKLAIGCDSITAILGNLDWTSDRADKNEIKSILIHPDYEDQENDIALLKLSEELIFNEFVQPIALPYHNYNESFWLDTKNFKYFIAGWGKAIRITNENEFYQNYIYCHAFLIVMWKCNKFYKHFSKIAKYPKVLRKLQVQYIENEECKLMEAKSRSGLVLQKSHLCATGNFLPLYPRPRN